MSSAQLACNPDAIRMAERSRYKDLITRLRTALKDRTELPFGYAYHLDLTSISLPEVAEWITLERLCCPFLSFQLDLEADRAIHLTLRGPNGVKAILQGEFPA